MKHERDVEEILKRFSPRPAPIGLKERTIRAVEQKAGERCLLTPGWRWALAVSPAFLVLLTWADWRISAVGQNRLDSLLNLRGEKAFSPEKPGNEEAADLLAYLTDLDPAAQKLLGRVFLEGERAAVRYGKPDLDVTEGIDEF